MVEHTPQTEEKYVLDADSLQLVFRVLLDKGYRLIGPRISDGAITYGELSSAADLPIGWTDRQDAGTYRIEKRDDDMVFGYTFGQHSWKNFLLPSSVSLWRAERKGFDFHTIPAADEFAKYAFIGVRPCELHAIAAQDNIFINGDHVDRTYQALRKNAFIIAVNCTQPSGTCFCTSMNTGPRAAGGFDLALTEVLEANRHYFLAEVGSSLGSGVLVDVPHRVAGEAESQSADRALEKASNEMGRTLDVSGLKELLYSSHEHEHWGDVAERCLTCGNCTMVCPTCFCNTVEDITDLKGETAERRRRWDSCFTVDFTYIHGGSTRPSARSRYRQWLTHKLATWQDQFGTMGCVGCGRCITWCPVGIDITEEVRAIRGVEIVSKPAFPVEDRTLITIKRVLAEHPFIKDMTEEQLAIFAECTWLVRFNPGEYMLRAKEEANRFYLIRYGQVAIEVFSPERGAIVIQTIGEGDILGWSWRFPPFKWRLDARVIELTRAIAVDANCFRRKCEEDRDLGYLVHKHLAHVINERIEATRMQLLDVYGEHS